MPESHILHPRSIAGRVAIVTGAASGIGRATAELFGAEGAHVAVLDINSEGARAVVDVIQANGGSAQAWTLDLVDGAAIARAVSAIATKFGGIDLLVNNAGIAGRLPIDDSGYEANWDRLMAVMLAGPQRMVRACLSWLRMSATPRIVNVASTEALGGTARNSAYAASKAGLVGFTRSLAVELGPEAITVNCICPGPVETGLTQRFATEERDAFARQRTALRRYGLPEELAHMILALCQPGASYVTGVVIPVDGGLMARNA